MAYSTISKPGLHFNTKLYTGNGGTNAITGVGFQPDKVWIKERNGTNNHEIHDVVRGVNYQIYTNLNNAQTNAANHLTTFGTDGFTVGSDGAVNTNSNTYCSWNWKAGGSTSSNSNGSITSTVSANTTAGFSIVKYTGTGSDATVGHGLGVVPAMIMVKAITTTAHDWVIYHKSMGNDKAIALNLNNAQYTATGWQSTTPTNQVFYIKGAANSVAGAMDFIAYCFAEIKGYSKFGKYTGNGNADGAFIYTGFKPAFIMHKRTDTTEDWGITDVKRNTFNVVDKKLRPNANIAEVDQDILDINSNGFKWRTTSGEFNSSGGTYIYMAFAEEPLVANVGNSIPATAR